MNENISLAERHFNAYWQTERESFSKDYENSDWSALTDSEKRRWEAVARVRHVHHVHHHNSIDKHENFKNEIDHELRAVESYITSHEKNVDHLSHTHTHIYSE